MVINFRTRRIGRDIYKLTRTPTLNFLKKVTYPAMWDGTPSNYVYYGSRDNLLWICTKILASSFSLLIILGDMDAFLP